MRYYRCKCGKSEAWGSMGPYQCSRCSVCGSDLAEGPESHRPPRAHQMLARPVNAQTDTGLVVAGELTECIWCQQTKAEIEARGEPMEIFNAIT